MLRRFFLCYFETTRKCNLSCPYCTTRNGDERGRLELSTEEAKHLVLDEVARYSSKAAVAFSGGEFLLRNDALELLQHNAELGMWSFVNTNGELLDKRLLEEIKEATQEKITFVFSLDSIGKDKDTVARQGSLERLEERTRLCNDAGVAYFFVVTITRSNMHELKEVVEYATRNNTPVLRSPLVPRGCGAGFRHLMFNKEDMEKVIHPVLRETYLSYISHVPFFAAPRFFQKNWLKAAVAIKQLGCQAGRGYVGISAEGDVAPCVHLLDTKVVCGNVRTAPLSEILRENPLLKALRARKTLKGKCGRCKYVDTCGGCRALAYYHSGDVFAEDPTCFFEPETPKSRCEYEDVQNENMGKFAEFITTRSPWKDIF